MPNPMALLGAFLLSMPFTLARPILSGADATDVHRIEKMMDGAEAGPTSSHDPTTPPGKHEPTVVFEGGMAQIRVRGEGGSTDTLHPMSPEHHVAFMWAKDQEGRLLYVHGSEKNKDAESTWFTPPKYATTLTPYEYCNLHGLWKGPSFDIPGRANKKASPAKMARDAYRKKKEEEREGRGEDAEAKHARIPHHATKGDKTINEAMLAAAGKGEHDEVIDLIDNKGANPSYARPKDGWTALHTAAWEKDDKLAMILLDRKAHPAQQNKYRQTPLHIAAMKGAADIAIALLEGGVPVDTADVDGYTPLMNAVDGTFGTLVELLLVKGASPAKHDLKGVSALKRAMDSNNKDVMDAIGRARRKVQRGDREKAHHRHTEL